MNSEPKGDRNNRTALTGWLSRVFSAKRAVPPDTQNVKNVLGVETPPEKTKTAFVFSGSGGKGSAQVGMLGALFEAGIVPDFIVGVSAGALNGAVFAQDPGIKGIRTLDHLWRTMKRENIFSGNRFATPIKYAQKIESVFPSGPLRELIDEELEIKDLAETEIPLYVLACDYHSGEEYWFSDGPPDMALYATAALPGILPPIEVNGLHLIDGGVVNNFPISKAIELGANRICVFVCASMDTALPEAKRPLEAIIRTFHLTKMARFKSELASIPTGTEVTILECAAAEGLETLDFSHSDLLIEQGYLSACETLGIEPSESPEWITKGDFEVEPIRSLRNYKAVLEAAHPVGTITSLVRNTKSQRRRHFQTLTDDLVELAEEEF